jgi:hypothetical protein
MNVSTERGLTRAAHGLVQAEQTLERADRVLRPGVIRPRTDAELAAVVGIATSSLQQVIEYIRTGEVDLGLGDCPDCRGWGRLGDDIWCGRCEGTGAAPGAD